MQIKPWTKPKSWQEPTDAEVQKVTELLKKKPAGEFQIVIRDPQGNPQVIENAPFFFDSTPMPTRYWLVDPDLLYWISKLESLGGVKQVQQDFSLEEIATIHKEYELGRDAAIDMKYEGPRPSGGVGGTRQGVKCLHAHVANYLVDSKDFVGKWALNKINELKKEET